MVPISEDMQNNRLTKNHDPNICTHFVNKNLNENFQYKQTAIIKKPNFSEIKQLEGKAQVFIESSALGHLGHKGGGCARLVLPVGGQHALDLVVPTR